MAAVDQDEEFGLLGWETFFEELGSFMQYSCRNFYSASDSYANYAVERLEVCIIALNALKENLEETTESDSTDGEIVGRYLEEVVEMLSICRTLSVKWEQKLDDTAAHNYRPLQPPVEARSGKGRPRFEITKEQLIYLSSMAFSWNDISVMLGVSRMTIYRRRVEYDLVHDPRSIPCDLQLRTILKEIKHDQPELGEVMIMGIIRAMGHKVTRHRLREAIRITDPLHTALRWRGGLTSRRPYSVPGPNSLWHIGELPIGMHTVR